MLLDVMATPAVSTLCRLPPAPGAVTWPAIGRPCYQRLSGPGLVTTLASRLSKRCNQRRGLPGHRGAAPPATRTGGTPPGDLLAAFFGIARAGRPQQMCRCQLASAAMK